MTAPVRPVHQNRAVTSPISGDDPGWKPGSGTALATFRVVWIAYLSAQALLAGVVAFLAVDQRTSGSWLLPAGMVAVASVAGAALPQVMARPLDASDAAALLASYRARFFVRTAFANMVPMVGFAAFVVSGRPLAYGAAAVVGILLLVLRAAPSQGNLARDQAELDLAGSPVRLVDALSTPLAGRA